MEGRKSIHFLKIYCWKKEVWWSLIFVCVILVIFKYGLLIVFPLISEQPNDLWELWKLKAEKMRQNKMNTHILEICLATSTKNRIFDLAVQDSESSKANSLDNPTLWCSYQIMESDVRLLNCILFEKWKLLRGLQSEIMNIDYPRNLPITTWKRCTATILLSYNVTN